MRALGLDAATSTGWGIVEFAHGRLRLLDFGIARVGDHRSLGEVVAKAVQLDVETAAIEVPYVDKNADTAIKLGIVVGRWMQELDRARMSYVTHKANDWQRNLLGGLIQNAAPRAARKRAASMWVASMFKIQVREDEADGICMAAWVAKVHAVMGRTG
jgi:Holliday junction resolvasome RuvABC endonuclease subunit